MKGKKYKWCRQNGKTTNRSAYSADAAANKDGHEILNHCQLKHQILHIIGKLTHQHFRLECVTLAFLTFLKSFYTMSHFGYCASSANLVKRPQNAVSD